MALFLSTKFMIYTQASFYYLPKNSVICEGFFKKTMGCVEAILAKHTGEVWGYREREFLFFHFSLFLSPLQEFPL